MIPLKDMTPRGSVPVMTLLLIAVNVVVFIHQISLSPAQSEAFVRLYGLVPAKLSLALAGRHYSLADALIPLFTCMFLHGGWLHIIGNMWFLWIFGARVECRMGPFIYLIFYLVCGIASGATQLIFSWGSNLPSIGASGAISAVLGAYVVFFPSSRILTLIPLFIIWFTWQIPAILFIGLWFAVQFVSGIGSLNDPRAAHLGGVAWWAHVGGFLMGMLLAYVMNLTGRRKVYG
ncbi:MAG TPA: rhomboid family intramembrane serine protease [Candidatus Acidoferrales bacterium]|nr:rhomboid family intramembrane serine protease [Candidatus Acidoferrales bacterium]